MGELPITCTAVQSLIVLLQKCRLERNVSYARRLHAYMREHHLESHRLLGNYLVPTLVDCGCLPDAQRAFDQLPLRSEQSWCSLILGYIHDGDPQHALHLYQYMQQDHVQPSPHTFVALLKACSNLQDAHLGAGLHTDIVKHGLEKDTFVGNTLVDMYGKSGSLAEARNVFDKLRVRDIVSWTTIIAEYVEHGFCEEALSCFERMHVDAVSPNATTYPCCLKACSMMGDEKRGQWLFVEVVRRGFEEDLFIGSAIVDMYGKCGLLGEARLVFDNLHIRDAASWNALIAGYAEHGLVDEAQTCFEQMQSKGIYPVSVTYVCCLKACGTSGSLAAGRKMHCEIIKRGSGGGLYVGNALVDMYIKCRSPSEARQVFDNLPDQGGAAWNALITGYAEHGFGEEALACFKQMQQEGFSPLPVSFVCSLKACGITKDADTGQELHTNTVKRGVDRELFVGTTLVDMYVKCGLLREAQEVFDRLPARGTVPWNALISGYAECGFGEEALKCFQQMKLENFSPGAVTLVCSLKACGIARALEMAQAVHNEVMKKGFERELDVGNTLVDIYAKCGLLEDAQELFDSLPARTVVPWTAMIAGFAENGLIDEALNLFAQMLFEGVTPDANMFFCSLRACGFIGALEMARQLHIELTKRGLEKESYVGHVLVDVYARWGSLAEAQDVFDELPVRVAISWNAMLVGYAEHGFGDEAMDCFKQMQLEGVSPVAITFASRLKACGSIGALLTGREIHAEVTCKGFDIELFVGNTLVDTYGKCGLLAEAWDVFNKLPVRDVVSWNAMLTSYGENHESGLAIECFEDMKRQDVKPDAITFTCLLAACSQANLVSQGQEYFRMMREEYQIEPIWDHYTCIVDLLARAGYFHEVDKFCEAMQCLPSTEILRALLTACKIYGKVDLGLKYFQGLIQLDQEDGAAYSLMADIFLSAGRWYDADKVEEMRKRVDAKKKPASAVIELNRRLFEFVVGDHHKQGISGMLETLSTHMKDEGFVPMLNLIVSS